MEMEYRTDEKELLIRLRQGDGTAFTEIFNRYHVFLFMQAYKLTQDESDGQDIVQDVFVNVWANRQKLDVQAPLVIYLSQCVRFGFFKKMRSKEVRAKYENDLAFFIQREESLTDALLLEQELVARLKSVAEGMPDKMGRAFMMKHLEQYTNEEIAEALNISSKTVSNILSDANKDAKLKLGMRIMLSVLLP